jgi:hypothetical protein
LQSPTTESLADSVHLALEQTRRFIVYPEHCIWLLNLATIALNKSFHDKTNIVANGWKVSRMRFFLLCFCGMFVYFWLPGPSLALFLLF